MFWSLFNELLYKPFFNLLIFLYQTVAFEDLGIAIILLTLIVRFALYPLFYKGLKSQTLLMKIQPHVKKIQEEHKGNRERQAQELMNLYKTHKVNPFSGIFIMLLQLPILIAVYQVFVHGLGEVSPNEVYSFITAPHEFKTFAFGLIDLTKTNILITFCAAAAQYIQVRLSQSQKVVGDQKGNPAAAANKIMMYVAPGITIWILSYLPSAIGVYWVVTSIFSAIQQRIVNNIIKNKHGNVDTGQPKTIREGTA